MISPAPRPAKHALLAMEGCNERTTAFGAACDLAFTEALAVGDLILVEAIGRRGANFRSSRAVWTAVENDQAECVRLLWELGADLDITEEDGNTPLHIAVKQRKKASVDALLECHANRQLRNNDGRTPLQELRDERFNFKNEIACLLDSSLKKLKEEEERRLLLATLETGAFQCEGCDQKLTHVQDCGPNPDTVSKTERDLKIGLGYTCAYGKCGPYCQNCIDEGEFLFCDGECGKCICGPCLDSTSEEGICITGGGTMYCPSCKPASARDFMDDSGGDDHYDSEDDY